MKITVTFPVLLGHKEPSVYLKDEETDKTMLLTKEQALALALTINTKFKEPQ